MEKEEELFDKLFKLAIDKFGDTVTIENTNAKIGRIEDILYLNRIEAINYLISALPMCNKWE